MDHDDLVEAWHQAKKKVISPKWWHIFVNISTGNIEYELKMPVKVWRDEMEARYSK